MSSESTTERTQPQLWRVTVFWFGVIYLVAGAAAAAADPLHLAERIDRTSLTAAGAGIATLGALAVTISRSLRAAGMMVLVALIVITAGFAVLGLSALSHPG